MNFCGFWYLFTFKPPRLVSEQPLDTDAHPLTQAQGTSSSMATHTHLEAFPAPFQQQSSFPAGKGQGTGTRCLVQISHSSVRGIFNVF